jgi:hypothetical protein
MEYLEAMRPKPQYVRLFREIVLDVWKEGQQEIIATRKRLQQQLDALNGKKDRVVDAFLHRHLIDRATYERQVAKLDEEITLANITLHERRIEEIDVEGVLGFAEHLLSNPARMWCEASPNQNARFVYRPQELTTSRPCRTSRY